MDVEFFLNALFLHHVKYTTEVNKKKNLVTANYSIRYVQHSSIYREEGSKKIGPDKFAQGAVCQGSYILHVFFFFTQAFLFY